MPDLAADAEAERPLAARNPGLIDTRALSEARPRRRVRRD